MPLVFEPIPSPRELALADYRALADRRARDYERTQDISPYQLLILLEVAERTGASLGQLLATGEHESARTWNDFVRPTLPSGRLGSAAGVWQFQPATFHAVIRRYGKKLLAASDADAATGRTRLDLSAGPFSDGEVRAIVRETVDGTRGPDDEALGLLRHNFAVLAFAKHYLSLDSGAADPVEDYLFHFLGAAQGRQVLALARGPARDTLCVKRVEPDGPDPDAVAAATAHAPGLSLPASAVWPATRFPVGPGDAPPLSIEPRPFAPLTPATGGRPVLGPDIEAGAGSTDPAARGALALPLASAVYVPAAPPPVSSEHGFPADSPTVRGNLGMFYRDGKGQSNPYTWGEFLDHLARRVKAESQPALVRAKYGVGLPIAGGDLPGRAYDPEQAGEPAEFRFEEGLTLALPEAMVIGTLDAEEARAYKTRLAELLAAGEDRPLDRLPPDALRALRHLGLLPPDRAETDTAHPAVRKALADFRKRVGKAPPDDPAEALMLLPAERAALAIYDARIARVGRVHAAQIASAAAAPDLKMIRTLPPAMQRYASPAVRAVQNALVERGLLSQPVKKTVWRDKKRRKRVSYKTLAFRGFVDNATLAALDSFQRRETLRGTDGVLDAVTLARLGLPALGRDIVLPPAGPQCILDPDSAPPPRSEAPLPERPRRIGELFPTLPRPPIELPDPPPAAPEAAPGAPESAGTPLAAS